MTIHQAAQQIYSDIVYDSAELEQDEVINRAEHVLAPVVHEALAAHDVHDEVVLRAVGHLIARAMLEQHCVTDRIVSEMFIASAERQGGFK
jgi:hypothetical protein